MCSVGCFYASKVPIIIILFIYAREYDKDIHLAKEDLPPPLSNIAIKNSKYLPSDLILHPCL